MVRRLRRRSGRATSVTPSQQTRQAARPAMANQYTYGRTQRERILSRLLIDSESGCLLWTGFLDKDGYGRAWDGSSTRPVHRVVWEMLEGQIPSGMTLDHVK